MALGIPRHSYAQMPTRRGDLEILAYNLIQWSGTILPWEKNLSDPVVVQNEKKKYMANTKVFLKTCFGKKTVPDALTDFLEYVSSMSYDTEPDYKKLRTILTKGIKTSGVSFTGNLVFKQSLKHKTQENEEPDSPAKRQKTTPSKRTPRSKETTKDQTDSVRKLKAKKVSKMEEIESDETIDKDVPIKKSKIRRKKIAEVDIEDKSSVLPETNGYNAEMLRLQKKLAERNSIKSKKSKANSKNSNADLSTPDYLNEDIIDGTPPEKINHRKKKYMKTSSNNETSDSEVSPRSLRNRR